MSQDLTFGRLVDSIVEVHQELRRQAKLAVNVSLTVRNWLIGAYIHEYELQGADRADYGEKLIETISADLAKHEVSSVDRRQLYRYIDFYRIYPQIVGALSPQLLPALPASSRLKEIVGTLSPQSQDPDQTKLLLQLSYSHLENLVKLDSAEKRQFYQVQCLKGGWSVRELKRQIASLYFERTALSTNKNKLESKAQEAAEKEPPSFPIRDPYVFEFLGLKPDEVMGESTLENALLDKLQSFLLELGHGFCFEARQKRLLIGETYNFVDLVFYHRILKCHVLIELKVGPFSHEHIGQLNTYVSWYADQEMSEGDNPPVGVLLCTEKDSTVMKYALAGMSNQLFVSKYQVVLPTEDEIAKVLGVPTAELDESREPK